AVGYVVMELLDPGSGRSLWGLLVGAFVAGLLAVFCTTAIRRLTRLKADPAMAIVLGVFFGLGIALMTVVVHLPGANPAGLNNILLGAAARMRASDVMLIAAIATVAALAGTLLFKELSLLCFDEAFAATDGWPVARLDALLMTLVVSVTVIGIQSVGLLIVGLLIIPPAAARFWTERLSRMTAIAAAIGGSAAYVGVMLSSLLPRMATGPTIVLVASALFVVSLLCGARRGLLRRLVIQWELRRRIGRHDLLRAVFEEAERAAGGPLTDETLAEQALSFEELLAARTWTPRRLSRLLRAAKRGGLITGNRAEGHRLTDAGADESRRVVRNHRLWELYLIHHADVAPGHVDRSADEIEHVLDPEVIAELESLSEGRQSSVPPSPHEMVR
ncbi:MAG: iron chelate uptake ABC transporter family permease subunit, partial [Planctomycetaceae bacterium]